MPREAFGLFREQRRSRKQRFILKCVDGICCCCSPAGTRSCSITQLPPQRLCNYGCGAATTSPRNRYSGSRWRCDCGLRRPQHWVALSHTSVLKRARLSCSGLLIGSHFTRTRPTFAAVGCQLFTETPRSGYSPPEYHRQPVFMDFQVGFPNSEVLRSVVRCAELSVTLFNPFFLPPPLMAVNPL